VIYENCRCRTEVTEDSYGQYLLIYHLKSVCICNYTMCSIWSPVFSINNSTIFYSSSVFIPLCSESAQWPYFSHFASSTFNFTPATTSWPFCLWPFAFLIFILTNYVCKMFQYVIIHLVLINMLIVILTEFVFYWNFFAFSVVYSLTCLRAWRLVTSLWSSQ